MIGTPDQDAFLSKGRYAVITTKRANGSLASSVVFCVKDGDELIFSANTGSIKHRTVERDPHISVTMLDTGGEPPYGYVAVNGIATIQTDDIWPQTFDIIKEYFMAMEDVRTAELVWTEAYKKEQSKEDRVLIRVKPEHVYGIGSRMRGRATVTN